ncbi:MAG TPA: wax ester/triacylglycerol synthase family O-acyltransferase [Candidatus Limnocylindria bacterium]|nr:wax ester/triacylglycerol synthase family O-acyltransferase [Candidatus Limnocylindria bacterium]
MTDGIGYERLSAQDRSFLLFEDRHTHMHLGGVAIFEAGPLAKPDGGIAIERIRAHVAACLHLAPRYRQRLAFVPLTGQPVWVDDAQFNIDYHVRHTALPRPGGDDELRAVVSRIVSQQLDRGKPLWELWVVEGLADDRFAVVVKCHHAMADGISAFEFFGALLRLTPETHVDAPRPWTPQPAPEGWRLLRDELVRQVTEPLGAAAQLLAQVRSATELVRQAAAGVTSVLDFVASGLRPPAPTPLNRRIGPHRRFDWHRLRLADVQAVRERFGGTINDVVLATIAGGMRRFLENRGRDPRRGEFRVVVPVSVRREDERGRLSNRASGWLATLPVGEPNVRKRYAAVRRTTRWLKETRQERAAELLGWAAEFAMPGTLLSLALKLVTFLAPYNLIVTNVPGPDVPLYLLGARMVGAFPLVPLFEQQGVGVAILSYHDSLCFGLNADWDLVPDLEELSEAVSDAFAELHAAAVQGALRVTRSVRRFSNRVVTA